MKTLTWNSRTAPDNLLLVAALVLALDALVLDDRLTTWVSGRMSKLKSPRGVIAKSRS